MTSKAEKLDPPDIIKKLRESIPILVNYADHASNEKVECKIELQKQRKYFGDILDAVAANENSTQSNIGTWLKKNKNVNIDTSQLSSNVDKMVAAKVLCSAIRGEGDSLKEEPRDKKTVFSHTLLFQLLDQVSQICDECKKIENTDFEDFLAAINYVVKTILIIPEGEGIEYKDISLGKSDRLVTRLEIFFECSKNCEKEHDLCIDMGDILLHDLIRCLNLGRTFDLAGHSFDRGNNQEEESSKPRTCILHAILNRKKKVSRCDET
nr:hypothetical protein [Candidatus Sigynarchaeum springense]